MTILVGSRYMGQPVVRVPTANQGMQPCVFGPREQRGGNFSFYTVSAGDRLDNIAALIYEIPDYWWRIAGGNPEIFYPDALVNGSIIRVPA